MLSAINEGIKISLTNHFRIDLFFLCFTSTNAQYIAFMCVLVANSTYHDLDVIRLMTLDLICEIHFVVVAASVLIFLVKYGII